MKKKDVFYINVLSIDKDVEINIKDILKRLNSISPFIRNIDEISKMIKNAQRSK